MSQPVRVAEADRRTLERWDESIERSVNGTLFHLRQFLAYHGDRFRESERFLLILDGDRLIAQIPVAILEEDDGRHLRTPYGASYGGFAFQRYPTFTQARRIVEAFLTWGETEGVTCMTITPPLAACSLLPLDVVHFALLAAGFRSVNRDISSGAALDSDRPVTEEVSSRARQNARKAQRAGVVVEHMAALPQLWSVLEANFERHNTSPTHTQDELTRLVELLPSRVFVDVAYHDGVPVAGVVYFIINRSVINSFYICQLPDRRELNGLTLCLLEGLERAQRDGYRWFDFGTSTVGMRPRENVFRFKEGFSAVGQFRETFQWTAQVPDR
jgi:hypothetical protein